MHGDVVEEEDQGCCESHGGEDAAEELGRVNFVEDFGRGNTLGLHARDGEVPLFLGEPLGCCRAVGEREEGDDGYAAGDDALDSEDHPPGMKASEVGELQDTGCEKTTKCSSQGRGDDVERETECEFAASIPTGKVVRDTRHHTGLAYAKSKPNTSRLCHVVHECCADRADTEPESDGREEPSRAHELAAQIRRNLEDDVRDVKDREHFVVVVTSHVKIFLESDDLGVAYCCTV